jgi:hypothetical protein
LFFFPKSTKNKYTTTFGSPTAQKYAQTSPLDDGVSSLFDIPTIFLIFWVEPENSVR